MKPNSDAVVLLPTYNERENIENIVPAILDSAKVDVCILDDNSPDGTGDVADALARAHTRVHVIHRPGKQGLGKAYINGFQEALKAGYNRILEMDADFSHPPAHLSQLLALSDTYDVVLGSRWISGGGTENWPWYRQLISRAGSLYARMMLGVDIRDLTGGFKCFRREVLERLPLDNIRSTGYAFQIEVTYRALKMGFTVTESPFVFVEREAGVSKMSKKIVAEAVVRVPMMRLRRYT